MTRCNWALAAAASRSWADGSIRRGFAFGSDMTGVLGRRDDGGGKQWRHSPIIGPPTPVVACPKCPGTPFALPRYPCNPLSVYYLLYDLQASHRCFRRSPAKRCKIIVVHALSANPLKITTNIASFWYLCLRFST
jgi:hypothetical protein